MVFFVLGEARIHGFSRVKLPRRYEVGGTQEVLGTGNTCLRGLGYRRISLEVLDFIIRETEMLNDRAFGEGSRQKLQNSTERRPFGHLGLLRLTYGNCPRLTHLRLERHFTNRKKLYNNSWYV